MTIAKMIDGFCNENMCQFRVSNVAEDRSGIKNSTAISLET